MAALFITIFSGVLTLANSILPGNPFEGLIADFAYSDMVLGWLNWFVPIGDILTAHALWVAAFPFIIVFRVVVKRLLNLFLTWLGGE